MPHQANTRAVHQSIHATRAFCGFYQDGIRHKVNVRSASFQPLLVIAETLQFVGFGILTLGFTQLFQADKDRASIFAFRPKDVIWMTDRTDDIAVTRQLAVQRLIAVLRPQTAM